jgi:hypothetical protein
MQPSMEVILPDSYLEFLASLKDRIRAGPGLASLQM